eukprot:gene5273-1019_t
MGNVGIRGPEGRLREVLSQRRPDATYTSRLRSFLARVRLSFHPGALEFSKP